MENWKRRAVALVGNLLTNDKENPSVVPYIPQKTIALLPEKKYFRRVRPERRGISSSRIYAMLCELESEPRANLHSIMVLSGGEVVAECSSPGYSVNMPHLSHSMSKTVTGFAIGMLVDDGALSLDDKVTDFFPEYKYTDKRFAEMTVEHLLKMSSGSDFAEVGSVTASDWVGAFFASELSYAPGEGFSYNSMNSYLLARIVRKITNRSLTDFLGERLFSPLRISNFFWEKSADGTEKGGWGLYVSCESWAKLGLMALNGGIFEGKRILSQEWINASTSLQNISDGRLGDFDYGYQLWVGRDGGDFLFNGMFGQNVWVCPKNNLLVSVNCGNNELFQRSPTLSIIRKYLGVDMRDLTQKASYFALRQKEKSFFNLRREIIPKPRRSLLQRIGLLGEHDTTAEWDGVVGEYAFAYNRVGILPFLVRVMQNNLSSSVDGLKIERGEDSVAFTFRESGETYLIAAGVYDFRDTVLDFRGEKYAIRAACEASNDGTGEPLYRLQLIFPELPNTRMIEMRKTDEGLYMRFLENPDKRVVESFASTLDMLPAGIMLTALLKRALGDDFLSQTLDILFSPTLHAIDVNDESFDVKIQEENVRVSEIAKRYKDLMPLLSRFIGDSDTSERRSPFSLIGTLFRGKM